jgi:hypothetical protein
MCLLTQGNEVLTGLGLFEIFFPLQEELVFFFVIAGFAAGDEVAFGTAAAADNGNDVVHGEFGGLEFLLAVIAEARGFFSLPPLAGPKLPGLSLFSSYFLRRKNRNEWIG